jgi:hypothetical protein
VHSESKEIVVFQIIRDSQCAECGEELERGHMLRLEANQPLCLACADLSHLVFLPRGEAALTRRAGKYSKLRAVVVRFSTSRKRYERQGLLVEKPALAQAEAECIADADARARARYRAAEREALLDEQYIKRFADEVGRHYPSCPDLEREIIAEHACLKYSGRVGRTAAAKRFEPEAIDWAVSAHVRHSHTRYDELLVDGLERNQARRIVANNVVRVLDDWRKSKT